MAQGTISNYLGWNIREHNVRKRMYMCMCDWITLLNSRKLTERCKPAKMEENKNHYRQIKMKSRTTIRPSNPTFGYIIPQQMKSGNKRISDICVAMFTVASSRIVKLCKQCGVW